MRTKYKRTRFNYLVLYANHRIECENIKTKKTVYLYVIDKHDNLPEIYDYMYLRILNSNNIYYPKNKFILNYFYIESPYKIKEKRLRLYRNSKSNNFELIPRNDFSCLSCEEYEKINDEYNLYHKNVQDKFEIKQNNDYCNIL